ncbi:hypothetical protein PC118_g16652 [Phytophthora cactorum]|uniref:Uncharacterized protein n=1 Tax=Phytophthora cactorum TaxID=29920 RepID=A0A8T1FI20_9STRA|nr:hypothetical protein PC112_g20095 [Phytophthora cactorum]KAG2801781.1 hypothetical protein PC111_g19394 [Phytophthora cactorum]KAG2836708.1 hypothetical protein PC113_g19970 [Phytophthora cactorum]KAG2880514.1 hypothetical protein PC114_g22046 [Phytophthora cactorum]KAG2902710.1 hypothetical protein PC115_g15521 [Phytophthora cactorum]
MRSAKKTRFASKHTTGDDTSDGERGEPVGEQGGATFEDQDKSDDDTPGAIDHLLVSRHNSGSYMNLRATVRMTNF